MTKASVIGAGRWGTFLAWYLSEYNRADEVYIYGLEKSKTFQKLRENRKNEYLSLQNNITFSQLFYIRKYHQNQNPQQQTYQSIQSFL